MAELIIDLSGRTGLGERFHGDIDTVTPKPSLRVSKQEPQLTSGLFNPYLRDGYLCPVSNSKTSVSASSAVSDRLGSGLYYPDSNLVFAADTQSKVYKLDSLTDTSLSLLSDLYTSADTRHIFDLEMYMLNSINKLYAIGSRTIFDDGTSDFRGLSYVPPATTFGRAFGFTAPGYGSSIPTIDVMNSEIQTSSNNLTDITVTIPVESNQVLVAVFFSPNNPGGVDAFWNGDAMTSIGTGSGDGYYASFYLENPDQGAYTLRFSTSTITNRIGMWAVLSDVDLASFSATNCDASAITADGYFELDTPATGDNSLYIQFTATDSTTLTHYSNQERYDLDSDNSYYRHMDTVDLTGKYLQVAVFDSAGTLEEDLWIYPQSTNFSTSAVGGFYQKMNSDWAFMRKADNGFAYIFADNLVHKVDGNETGGSSGSITKSVLKFPSNFRIVDAIDYGSRMFICLHQYPVSVASTTKNTFDQRTGILIWNRVSTQFNTTDYIELPGVREIKKIYASPDGVLKLIVISNNGIVELKQFGYNDSGGAIFRTLQTLGIGAFPQYPDGVVNAGDKTMWLANDGRLYSEKGNALTSLFEFKSYGTTTAGVLNNIGSGLLLYGSGDETGSTGYRSNKQAVIASFNDSSAYVYKVYPLDLRDGSNNTQTPHTGDVYSEVLLLPIKSVIRNIRIYNAPTSSSSATEIATIKIYFNQSSTAGMTKTVTLAEASRGYVDFHINKPYAQSVQIEIEWSTGTSLGDDMYMPSMAVISYDQTQAQSPDNG